MRLHNHYSDFSFSVNNEFSFSHSNWETLYVTHVTDLTDNLFTTDGALGPILQRVCYMDHTIYSLEKSTKAER